MKYEDVLKRFVSTQAQLLQEKQMRQQQREQMLAEKAQGLQSFVPGMQGHSPEEEYTESEHNPFEESQEYYDGGEMDEDPPRYGLTKTIQDRGPVNIVLHEWRDLFHDVRNSSRPWLKRLGYFLHGPGWRPKD